MGDIVDSSGFAMVTLMGHSFLNNAYSPDVYNITPLVDSHVCGQGSNSMFPKGLENLASAPPLSFCVCHLGPLLKDGCRGLVCHFLKQVGPSAERAQILSV